MSKYGTGKDLPVPEFIWGHLTHQVPKPEADLNGRTALITGATSGYVSSLDYSQQGLGVKGG